MEKITHLLQKVTLFSDLNEQELHEIAQRTHSVHFAENEVIFSEGNQERKLYIVESGEVLIYKQLSTANPHILASYSDGNCFNELSLFEKTSREVTAKSIEETHLLIFDDAGLQSIMDERPRTAARILHKLLSAIAGRTRAATNILAEKTHLAQDLRKQEITDKLTGLYSRNYFDEKFSSEFPDPNQTLGLLVFKPDQFKAINDVYGHKVGDQVLKKIAHTLSESVQQVEKVIRYRGNEFIILLPDTSLNDVVERAESLRNIIQNLNVSCITRNDPVTLTATLAVAHFNKNTHHILGVIEKAYEVLFELINLGGNRVGKVKEVLC